MTAAKFIAGAMAPVRASAEVSIAAAPNMEAIKGEARSAFPQVENSPGHFYDPVSGRRSDDLCHAVHDGLASTTFRLLQEAFETSPPVLSSSSDDVA